MDPSIVTYRELYYPSPGPGAARWLTPAYTGKGLERAEILSAESESDAYRDWQRRVSSDNGGTWSAPWLPMTLKCRQIRPPQGYKSTVVSFPMRAMRSTEGIATASISSSVRSSRRANGARARTQPSA